MKDCIVIGAGIIGSTITHVLRKRGMDVTVFDDGRSRSGTFASGGHLKPSWFGGMKKEEYEPAMQILDEIWGLNTEEFRVRPTKKTTTVYRVDTDKVVGSCKEFTNDCRVRTISLKGNFPRLNTLLNEYYCKLLIVAAGAWCQELLPQFSVQQKQGISFRYNGKLDQPFIKPWAPYKQIVAHQQTKHRIWCGDGSAILVQNWDKQRTDQCQSRCRESLIGYARDVYPEYRMGLRAYCKTNGVCLFEKVHPRCYVITGAGKSGTIAAGYSACRLLKELV